MSLFCDLSLPFFDEEYDLLDDVSVTLIGVFADEEVPLFCEEQGVPEAPGTTRSSKFKLHSGDFGVVPPLEGWTFGERALDEGLDLRIFWL